MLVATLMATGCGESGAEPPTAPPEPPRPTQVAVRPAEARLAALDATVQLTPEVRDQNGQIMSGAAVAWTSSDAAVARVNASGLVTAVRNGSATITAAAGGAAGTATVTVEQEVTALTLGQETLVFRAFGDTLRLVAEAADANGNPITVEWTEMEWTSSDTTVARVDAAGLVTAVDNGSVTITASAAGATAMAIATVEQEAATLTLDPEALLFRALGDTLRLMAEAADANGHPMEVEWASSDSAVAHVEASGLVTAVGNGSTTITVTAGVAVRSAVVVVDQVAVVFELAPEAVQFRALGDTLRLVAEAADANGHPIAVTWTSSNAAVAAVDTSGLVTARGNGSARITVAARVATGSATVTVEQKAVALGGLPSADTLLWYGEPSDTLRLVATAVDANGHQVEGTPVEWSTSYAGVATVDDGGLVLGTGEGVATITAAAASLGRATTKLTVVNRDRAALTAFYHATGGPDWKCSENWITHVRMSAWCGVSTSRRADGVEMVTHLDLSENNLTGPIVPELGSLANLIWLRLDINHLTGPIPPELGNLAYLGLLSLWHNRLTGSIPPELGNLANLGSLSLGHNRLTGPIPPELGNLANLRSLWLYDNQLTGPIPPELGSLANLGSLRLGHNRLTGSIPPELGNLADLSSMELHGNQLTGSIPPELGNLANLSSLLLGYNRLTGPIPPELGRLANLRWWLYLGNNNLRGPIPPELGNLAYLSALDFSENQLTGSIPSELGNLAYLESLSLDDNQLTGQIPSALGNLTNLKYLYLSDNQLTGSIPPELGNLANLGDLYLDDNELTGKIPPELGSLANLGALGLSDNQLTGSIPPELSNLNLHSLTLNDNQLTGSILPELGNLTRLYYLKLHGNATLSGRLPDTFTQLQLSFFYWYNTQLCHPPTAAFRQWLQGIHIHQGGPPCGS